MGAAQATGFYRFEAKIISRGGGRSLVASAAYRTGGKSAASAAAYRAGVQLTDERTGISYDYTKKARHPRGRDHAAVRCAGLDEGPRPAVERRRGR